MGRDLALPSNITQGQKYQDSSFLMSLEAKKSFAETANDGELTAAFLQASWNEKYGVNEENTLNPREFLQKKTFSNFNTPSQPHDTRLPRLWVYKRALIKVIIKTIGPKFL
jgi:hypothetical protein